MYTIMRVDRNSTADEWGRFNAESMGLVYDNRLRYGYRYCRLKNISENEGKNSNVLCKGRK